MKKIELGNAVASRIAKKFKEFEDDGFVFDDKACLYKVSAVPYNFAWVLGARNKNDETEVFIYELDSHYAYHLGRAASIELIPVEKGEKVILSDSKGVVACVNDEQAIIWE